MTGSQSDGTTTYAIFEWSESFAQFTADPVADLDHGCAVIQFEVYDSSRLVARFGWDLSPAGADSNPLLLDPLIVESRNVDVAPTEAAPCEGTDSIPTREGAGPGMAHATPAAALADFVAVTEQRPKTGYVELIAPDRVVYGTPVDGWGGDGPEFTILITVVPSAGGAEWAVTRWIASGC